MKQAGSTGGLDRWAPWVLVGLCGWGRYGARTFWARVFAGVGRARGGGRGAGLGAGICCVPQLVMELAVVDEAV